MDERAGWEPRARAVFERLVATYGEPTWDHSTADPLDELIGTILSQHTSDLNSGRAFAALKARFPTWRAALDADPQHLADSIRAGGLAEVKTRTIRAVLAAILADRGELDLEFLRDAPDDAARRYLESLPGVGPKTAACVLVFSLNKPALPVDTHVHRVARRLGMIPPKLGAEPAHAALEAQVPPARRYAFHVLMIRHGRRICKAPRPLCERCPLLDSCPRVGVEEAR